MKTRLTTAIIFLLVAALSAPAALAQEKVLLKYDLQPGSISVYRINLRGLTTTTIGEMKQKVDIDTELYVSQAVEAVAKDGTTTITTSIDSGRSDINGEVTIPDNVGQRFTATMDRTGKILEAPVMPDGNEMSQMQIAFPSEPLAIGAKWTRENELQGGKVKLIAEYELAGFEQIGNRRCAKIVSVVTSAGGGNPSGRTFVGMKANGVIHFAYDDGLIVKNVVTSFMDIKMTSSFGEQEQEILTKMFMTMTMELRE